MVFKKKTKTPKRAIKIAEERKKDYFWRKMAWVTCKSTQRKENIGIPVLQRIVIRVISLQVYLEPLFYNRSRFPALRPQTGHYF
jgi:hypothetical protein